MSEIDHHSRTVLRCAIGSRILLLTLIILWRSMFSPYDTSASINPSCLSVSHESPDSAIRFPSIASGIEESIVWDSVYFVRIAQCGYEYEQTYAFLPLLPIVISFLSNTVFWPLVPLIGYRAVLGLSGYFINNVAFVFAALYLYRLSLVILKDSKASLRASILFCFNPASIFYSSIYTESLYALFSIGGVYYLMSGASNFPVLWLAVSGSGRSNGVLNAGYYVFKALNQSYYAMYVKKHACLVLQVLLAAALRCICIFIPFLAFQAYGYYNICLGHSRDEMRPWCKKTVPLLYSFIQSHYWGVGFLQYFQLKQLPNFLLASPVLSLASCAIYSYAKIESDNFFSLGFGATIEEKNSAPVVFSGGEEPSRDDHHTGIPENKNLRRRQRIKAQGSSVSSAESEVSVNESGYYSVVMLPFIYHLGFMVATSFFVMHVQVLLNFVTSPLSITEGLIDSRAWQLSYRFQRIRCDVQSCPSVFCFINCHSNYCDISSRLNFQIYEALHEPIAWSFRRDASILVQVATRFLSTSPPLYWYASYVMASPGRSSRWGYLIWGYAASYILLGSLLFSNFYPFT